MLSPALVNAIWYDRHPLAGFLAPLSWLYRALVAARKGAYAAGLLAARRVGAPVVVIGNITVGGTGKTPLVIAVAAHLARRGWRPGIVCRGYRGGAREWPQRVTEGSDPAAVGDEAVLLARRARCPVAAAPDRVAASRLLVDSGECDVIVSDDGLQHLALHRDVEIAVIDATRRHGNGRCLPAGPLREPVSRLASVDLIVENGGTGAGLAMQLVAGDPVNLAEPERTRALGDFAGAPVHAVCGIGNPERFFATLEAAGLDVVRHPFPDHHPYTAADLALPAPVLMTEKDAVKCARFASAHHWVVPVSAQLPAAFCERLDAKLATRFPARNGTG